LVSENQAACFRLDAVLVSPSHNTLALADKTLKLQPKVMAVLHYLALNYTRVISSEELMERLWEGRIVTQGSVQKSINALRSALAELLGEGEIIAHYSKRGYQLRLEPQFIPVDQNAMGAAHENAGGGRPATQLLTRTRVLSLAGVAGVLLFVGYYFFTQSALPIVKNHQTDFHSAQGYTNETGYERSAEPHPDNMHVAYIRALNGSLAAGESQSEILIRNPAGKDWHLAKSEGAWQKLSWSPAGKSLVAIERKQRDGLVQETGFYEKSNDLYAFHIFSVDVDKNLLLEKQLLSQWHGRVYSVTWWDENTLEIVAKQGPTSTTARYRYSLLNQQLSMLDEVEGAANVIASSILHQQTAIASLHRNLIQIDFLNKEQQREGRWQLALTSADISWIPDGSGILVYGEDERKLLALYRDGQQHIIPLTDSPDKEFSQPRFRPDGRAIFYTEETRSANIELVDLNGKKTALTNNNNLNYAANFSPDGERVVYASVRNNQTQLWLIEQDKEKQLASAPIAKKVGKFVWSPQGDYLVYSVSNHLYSYSFLSLETLELLEAEDEVEPLAYSPAERRLLFLKRNGEARNLCRLDLDSHEQKQLTFGSLASALEFQGDIYFQYVGESGLWILRANDGSLTKLASKFAKNSHLLSVDDDGVFFIRGTSCHESAINYYQFSTELQTTGLKRATSFVMTSAFHPNKGALEVECYLPESNIMLLE
jgi:DNA-binding winged helix-turn-helix (wHTH) protein/WD40 repeat protein